MATFSMSKVAKNPIPLRKKAKCGGTPGLREDIQGVRLVTSTFSHKMSLEEKRNQLQVNKQGMREMEPKAGTNISAAKLSKDSAASGRR